MLTQPRRANGGIAAFVFNMSSFWAGLCWADGFFLVSGDVPRGLFGVVIFKKPVEIFPVRHGDLIHLIPSDS